MIDPCHEQMETSHENRAQPRSTQTHCLRGHELAPDNTYRHGGKRTCRACRRARDREQKRLARERRLIAAEVALADRAELERRPDGTAYVAVRGGTVIVDDADADFVRRSIWFAYKAKTSRTMYATRNSRVDGRKVKQLLHRVLWERWGKPPCREIDHVNHDGLDCRRRNLRAASHTLNMLNRPRQKNNRTGFIGIAPASNGRWRAMIVIAGKQKYLGTHNSMVAAAEAYNAAKRVAIAKELERMSS